ncbi:MAG: PAS domain S-box protein, partial [Calditrichales bacterium]|nr:PAS domain S-box protein [Calditrichales bacterium]
WWLWGASNGYAIFFVAPPFTLWIVWHGIFANLRRNRKTYKWYFNIYVIEIPFRILSTINLYTLSRWAITLNPPSWDWTSSAPNTIPIQFSNFVVVKQFITGYIILLLTDVLLNLKFVRKLFRLKEDYSQANTGYIISASLLVGGFFWIVDSVISLLVFHKGTSFLDLLALNIPPHDFFVRTAFIFVCLAGGLLASKFLRRQNESNKALWKSEERFQHISENLNNVIYERDGDGRLTYISPVVEKLAGYSQKEIMADPAKILSKIFIEPGYLKKGEEVRRKVISKNKYYLIDTETICQTKDGKKIWVHNRIFPFLNQKGVVSGFIGILEDISERKKAEEMLRESDQKYLEAIIKTSHDGIFVIDSYGNIEFGNDATFKSLGWQQDELIGKPFIKVIDPDVHDYVLKRWDEVQRGKGRAYEADIVRKNGERRSLLVSHRHMDIGDQRKYCVVIKDVTDRKRAEKDLQKYRSHLEELVEDRTSELKAANEQLKREITERKRAEKALKKTHDELEIRVRERTAEITAVNNELESFAYSVSHDLRAPLRAIDGFSKILLEENSDVLNKKGQRYLQRIRAGAQRMAHLIDDLLNLSRIGRKPIDKKTIKPKIIAEDVFKSLKEEYKSGKVEFTAHKCPTAFADPGLMQIVFTNLLSNALKFTKNKQDAKIEVGYKIKNKQKVFFVKDNGVGFDMKYADKLFSPFQRLHRVEDYEGSGIGLAIVQRIIHKHDGWINVESKPDSGTTFYFSLY